LARAVACQISSPPAGTDEIYAVEKKKKKKKKK
jgi:hypothetical protein